jgi:hypothetical protein
MTAIFLDFVLLRCYNPFMSVAVRIENSASGCKLCSQNIRTAPEAFEIGTSECAVVLKCAVVLGLGPEVLY